MSSSQIQYNLNSSVYLPSFEQHFVLILLLISSTDILGSRNSTIFFLNQSLLNGNLLNSHYNLDSVSYFTVVEPDIESGLFTGAVGEEALEPRPPQDRSRCST